MDTVILKVLRAALTLAVSKVMSPLRLTRGCDLSTRAELEAEAPTATSGLSFSSRSRPLVNDIPSPRMFLPILSSDARII